MGRTYAGILGLVAFATFVARGLIDHATGGSVMVQAAAGLFAFAAIGWIVGTLAETTIVQSVQATIDAEIAATRSTGGHDAGQSAAGA